MTKKKEKVIFERFIISVLRKWIWLICCEYDIRYFDFSFELSVDLPSFIFFSITRLLAHPIFSPRGDYKVCEVWIRRNGIWIWSWIQHRCSQLRIISCFRIYWNLDAWIWPWFWNVDSSLRDVVLSSFNLTNNCMSLIKP